MTSQRRVVALLAPVLAAAVGLGITPSSSSAASSSAASSSAASSVTVDSAGTVRAAPAYIAVIDAGSSGTRLALFDSGTGITAQQVYSAPAKTAGLSSYAGTTASAGPDSVQPLLDQLRAYVDGQGIAPADVPIALLATAGMRRLLLNDPVAVREIFASTRATIDASGFPLRANKILPDVQEALLAWLDANAQAGTLDTPRQDIGIVEVGGASAQVAFRSPRKDGPGVSTVRVSGKDIGVVAVSYLGLGANEARGFMQVASGGGASCFPNNASGTDPQFYLASSSEPVSSAAADFRGYACGRAYAGVIQDVARLSVRDVRPRNLSMLPGFARASFVGLGSIPFIYSDFGIASSSDDQRSLAIALRTTCKGPDAWLKVTALSPKPPTEITETLCSSGSYVAELLFGRTGIGLDPDRFAAQPGIAPTWPEGYAITVLHP